MKKKTFSRAGSEAQYGPRLAGAVLHDYLENSNEPLAVAYREHKAEEETEPDRLFREFFPDTHLGVDLKILSRKAGRMRVGEYINCLLTRDGEDHFEAIEDALKKQAAERRNPIIFKGMRINVHRSADGTLYPTFNRPYYTECFTFSDFCRKAAEELMAVAGLIKEK